MVRKRQELKRKEELLNNLEQAKRTGEETIGTGAKEKKKSECLLANTNNNKL